MFSDQINSVVILHVLVLKGLDPDGHVVVVRDQRLPRLLVGVALIHEVLHVPDQLLLRGPRVRRRLLRCRRPESLQRRRP